MLAKHLIAPDTEECPVTVVVVVISHWQKEFPVGMGAGVPRGNGGREGPVCVQSLQNILSGLRGVSWPISYTRALRLPERVTALGGSGWLMVGWGDSEGKAQHPSSS